MEAEIGVAAENDKHVVTEKVHVEESDVDVKKEEKNVSKNGQSSGNGVHENVKQDNGTLNVCGPEGKVCGTVKSKSLTDSKASNGGNPKNNKVPKDKPNVRGSTALARGITRPSLSQSLSFPAKGLHPEAMKKSIDVYPVKSDRQSRKIGAKAEGSILKKKVSSTSLMSTSSKEAKNVVNSKSENAKGSGAAIRHTTLASLPSLHKSVSGKSLSSNGTSNSTANEVSNDQDSKPKSTLPIREDEDARSTTSSATPGGTRKNTVSGFSFRLQERAEKRKEFFSTIEEKIQAREVEKSNLQAKSKENQEAEIKQLRKSLTFKATPMPNFYKEPPPKAELKKIPTTRAISPKLGRNKISSTASNNSLESGVSSLSPRVIKDQGKSPRALPSNTNKSNATSKKPVKSAQSKPQSRDSLDTKIEGKTVKTKLKPAEAKSKDENTFAETMIEIPNQPLSNPQVEEQINMKSNENSAEENRATLAPSSPATMPAEVTVES